MIAAPVVLREVDVVPPDAPRLQRLWVSKVNPLPTTVAVSVAELLDVLSSPPPETAAVFRILRGALLATFTVRASGG